MYYRWKILFIVLTGFFNLFLFSCDANHNQPDIQLTKEEESDLIFLREEEKLARDVYLYAFDKYGLTISQNISQSEQQHMDAVLQRLNFYNIDDPANNEIGIFNNQTLQDLYETVTTKIDSSIIDALLVGAIIEDLDIDDINGFLKRTNKSDIINLYNKLKCGSENHLRSYVKKIKMEGSTYVPKYISQDEFDEIIGRNNAPCQ